MPEVSVRTFLPVAHRDRRGDLHRPLGAWRPAGVPGAGAGAHGRRRAARRSSCCCLRCWARITGRRRGRLHPRPASGRGRLRQDRSRYLRHMLGMLLVGVMMYALFRRLRAVLRRRRRLRDGRGDPVRAAERPSGCWACCSLCKALATSLSLGSGSSGGIFSPSLFMGATLGGGFAALLNAAGFPIPLSIPAFAMVGMGAMVGGGTGAVMTAVVMIFEMTLELRHHHADDRRGGDERRRAPGAVAREHLHAQAGAARPAPFPRRCTPTCSWCAAPAR